MQCAHCTKQINYECPEPYVKEDELIKAILRYINFIEMAHPQILKMSDKLKRGMQSYKEIRDTILLQQDVDPDKKPLTFTEYAKHALKNGAVLEKREVVQTLGRQLYLHDKGIASHRLLNNYINPMALNAKSSAFSSSF